MTRSLAQHPWKLYMLALGAVLVLVAVRSWP